MEAAKYLITLVAVFNYGGIVADAIVPATAKQHLLNPRWPPHAKFHNAQTMLMGVINGTITLTILYSKNDLSLPTILLAASIASSYFVSMLAASVFPGIAWTDPEFQNSVARPLGLAPQQLVSIVLCTLVVIAIAFAVWVKIG